MKLTDLTPNPDNPRHIRDEKFSKLVDSIRTFDKMMRLRPMVVDMDGVILGGNMRYRALQHLGMDDIPDNWVIQADLTEEEKREFIIKDNVAFGVWDWDLIANEWDEPLSDWGLDVWQPETEVDYSILDAEDVSQQVQGMADGVKRGIQIEFEPAHYDEAYQLVSFWRQQGAYVGKMIMDYLKAEKDKL